MRNAQHEYEPSVHALERLALAVYPGGKGDIILRAATLPRGPQDETTADIEVHLYGARTGQGAMFRAWGISHSTVSSPDLQSRRREITVPKMNGN
jgi:hypothetical protein